MSELKEYRFIGTDELFHDANAGALYYEKSEADREIRKQKRKRCLALAKGFFRQAQYFVSLGADYKNHLRWAIKWENRFLAIADKFKEAL